MQRLRSGRLRITLLGILVMAIVCVTAKICMDLSQQPKTLYLHLYSNRYAIDSMSSKLPPPPRDMQCIASLSVVSGRRFYAHLPNHYEPEVRVFGTIVSEGEYVTTNFSIDIQDTGVSFEHDQKGVMELDRAHEFFDQKFQFVVSSSADPSSLD